jgi:DNA invertase Pin-like site-specific DNA recombinase
MSNKISPSHLQRVAYVYVRQSTGHQVRHHQESGRRQYALADRARTLGFTQVVIIDEDVGRSGSGLQERPGFGQLLTAVCEGKLGAVLALEASRLARNNRDWHHLIDLCALTDTLLIDDDGIYDPRQLNDRLVLGMKGSMAEYELGLMRQRARQAFEDKIRRGHVMWEVPVGFVRTEDDRIEKPPDLQVQQAITGVFEKFRQLGSARQTRLWYRDEQLPLPEVKPATAGREIIWRLPTGHRINQMLINPCYAGALAYGRTEAKTVIEDGRARQTTRRKKPRDQWRILKIENHPGYLSWDEFVANQQQLESNSAMPKDAAGGTAKRGPALLSGLLRCGHCGRKLNVSYSGSTGRIPRYLCKGGRVDRGSSSCLSVGGLRVDQAVEAAVLEAIQPAGVQASLDALDRLMAEHDTKRQALELALEKAHYEVQHARRQYDRVDPDYRLVASELERRWNDALQRVVEVETQLAELKRERVTLSEEQRQRLLSLGHDLHQVWHHPGAPATLKKRILRTVLHEIIIDRMAEPSGYRLHLHWQGGVHTELQVLRNLPGKHRRATDPQIIDLIGELSKVCRDATTAATLNRLGYCTGTGKAWRAHSIASVRHQYRLPNFPKGKDWVTLKQAAAQLRVSETVVKRLITQGTLPATQALPSAPWVIRRADLDLGAVQAEVQAVRALRLRPRHQSALTDWPLEPSDEASGKTPVSSDGSPPPDGGSGDPPW